MVKLTVEISFESQFGSARLAFEAAGVEKGEILEWANSIHLINNFFAPKAR